MPSSRLFLVHCVVALSVAMLLVGASFVERLANHRRERRRRARAREFGVPRSHGRYRGADAGPTFKGPPVAESGSMNGAVPIDRNFSVQARSP